MYPIYLKEIRGFFSSLIAYITISVFLIVTGLFLWVFPDSNLLDFGFANMDGLFNIAPWVFLLLIPAITMRFFSEERKSGTIELLLTRPLSDLQIILGKYFAALTLVLISLLPTLIYYASIWMLGMEKGNIDGGAVLGSYIGLFLLGSAFVSLGIFASAVTDNQIVAFTIAIFLCFFAYYGFDSISRLQLLGKVDNIIVLLGVNAHYESISRGVLDTRDLLYFISFSALFVLMTRLVLESRKW